MNRREFLQTGLATLLSKGIISGSLFSLLTSCNTNESPDPQTPIKTQVINPENRYRFSADQPGLLLATASLGRLVKFDANGTILELSQIGQQFVGDRIVESGIHFAKELPLLDTVLAVDIDIHGAAPLPVNNFYHFRLGSADSALYIEETGRSFIKFPRIKNAAEGAAVGSVPITFPGSQQFAYSSNARMVAIEAKNDSGQSIHTLVIWGNTAVNSKPAEIIAVFELRGGKWVDTKTGTGLKSVTPSVYDVNVDTSDAIAFAGDYTVQLASSNGHDALVLQHTFSYAR